MITRQKRFFACLALVENQQAKPTDHPAPAAGLGTWYFRTHTHPIDGNKMAVGTGGSVRPEGEPSGMFFVDPVVAVVRVGETTEVSFGLDFNHFLYNEHRMHLLPKDGTCIGFFPCHETSQATKDTIQVRVGESFETTTAGLGIDKLRGWPAVGKPHEMVVYLGTEMPTGWPTGDIVERAEAAITGRTAAFNAKDKIILGVPWLHQHNELLFSLPAEQIRQAVIHAKTLVAPPVPAPAEDDSE